MTLVGDHFTDNRISVIYSKDPQYKTVMPATVPQNLDQQILIETNFYWSVNNIRQFLHFSNFTCMFQVGDETQVTLGRMETLPLGALYDTDTSNDKPTHVSCSTPETHNSGKGTLKVSINGQDYH
jgi:hypothetical protein